MICMTKRLDEMQDPELSIDRVLIKLINEIKL